jgi:hypothetical protein
MFLLDLFLGDNDIDEKGMFMILGMGVSMLWYKTIETFHADIKTILVFLD